MHRVEDRTISENVYLWKNKELKMIEFDVDYITY